MDRRRIVIVIVIALMLLGGFAWWTTRSPGRVAPNLLGEGSTRIEQWCGRQLLRIANEHLGPELSYAALDFRFPKTLVLEAPRLTSEGIDVIEATSATIEFARPPRRGEPIVIETVELLEPTVRLIARPGGGLHGFGGMVTGSAGGVDADGGSTRPADVFAIRRIVIDGGALQYEQDGAPPMRLDELALELVADPSDDEPGWHELAASLSRSPVLEMRVDARLSLDTAWLSLQSGTADMTLAEDEYEVLPPSLQTLLRHYGVVGTMRATARGEVPLHDAGAGTLDLELQLAGASLRLDDLILPVDQLELRSRLAGRRLELHALDAATLGGTVRVDGSFELDGERRAELGIATDGIRLEHLVSDSSQLAGAASLSGTLTADLASDALSLSGSGRLDVTDGTLVDDPILGGVAERLGFTSRRPGTDRGSADLRLSHDRVEFSDIELVSPTFAARGGGEVRFDSSISFTLNAGPIERLQEALGRFGAVLGKLTDKVVDYEVTGTLDEPEVRVRPFGIGAGRGDR